MKWQVDRSLLDPQFAADVDGIPGDWVVTYGFRTFAEQDKLYQAHLAGGPLAAAPGHSAHEFGLAVDVARLVNGKEAWDYSNSAWPALWNYVRKSPRMHTGQDFPPAAEADPDHVQSTAWYALKKKLQAEGKW